MEGISGSYAVPRVNDPSRNIHHLYIYLIGEVITVDPDLEAGVARVGIYDCI